MNAKYKKQQGGIFMKYIMTGRNVEVTQAMREYAEKKLSRIEKFFNEDTEANVTFSVQKKRHILGVTIFFEGNTYRAEATNDDLYVSIDKGIDLLEGQLRKTKTKKETTLDCFPTFRRQGSLLFIFNFHRL